MEGCAYFHPVKTANPQHSEKSVKAAISSSLAYHDASSMKKRFNVDSPSFTPSSLAVNGASQPAKSLGLSPKAASAAPFRPKSAASG